MDVRRRRPGTAGTDRGAAAVEMALVLPILLLVVCGVIDFGRAYNAEITITQAAREGARLAARGAPGLVQQRVTDASTGLPGPTPGAAVGGVACPLNPPPGTGAVTVTVSYTFSFVTPFGAISQFLGGTAPGTIPLTARAVMRCGG